MKSFQVKGKETEELKQLYKNLQQEWDAFQQSKSTTASRKCPAPSNATIGAIQLRDKSPRKLMSNLQRDYFSTSSSPAEAWRNVAMMRTKDVAAQETLRERMEAIERGKLKGKRLFQPMEGESESETEMGFGGWRTDMGSHCEVRSLSFYYSEDEHVDDESSGSKLQPHCASGSGCSYSSSSLSSSHCLFGASVDNEQEVERVEDIVATAPDRTRRVAICRTGNGGRYAVFLGGLAIALFIIAICMSSERSSGGSDSEVILVPT